MSVLIKGGRVITAADDYVGDVYIEGERVSLIGESLDVEADKVIDAAGKSFFESGVLHRSRIAQNAPIHEGICSHHF